MTRLSSDMAAFLSRCLPYPSHAARSADRGHLRPFGFASFRQPDRSATGASRSLFGEPLDRTNRKPFAAAGVVVRAGAGAPRTEADVPRGEVAARARNRRPVVADRTCIVERSPVAVAGGGKENTGRGE